MAVLGRLRFDPRTRAYAERRTHEGLSKPEIIRCLKAYTAARSSTRYTRWSPRTVPRTHLPDHRSIDPLAGGRRSAGREPALMAYEAGLSPPGGWLAGQTPRSLRRAAAPTGLAPITASPKPQLMPGFASRLIALTNTAQPAYKLAAYLRSARPSDSQRSPSAGSAHRGRWPRWAVIGFSLHFLEDLDLGWRLDLFPFF